MSVNPQTGLQKYPRKSLDPTPLVVHLAVHPDFEVDSDVYRKRCRDNGVAAHPAMFPKALPEFFVRFLTELGDLVVDPFAGSNTTGKTADELGRRWIAIERNRGYLESLKYRWA